MGKKVFSIIIPTIVDSPPTLQSLPSGEDLIVLGDELIVARDRWCNASLARNIHDRNRGVVDRWVSGSH
jgi:hypothetical protein